MSGTSVVNYLLSNDAGVLAVVPATRIITGDLSLNTGLPAFTVKQISGVQHHGIRVSEAGPVRTDRVQVTAHSFDYDQLKALLELALTACANRRGTVNTVSVDSIVPDGVGPDLGDPDSEPPTFEQSRDFLVRWIGA